MTQPAGSGFVREKGRMMSDPTVPHRDPELSYWSYEQWLAARAKERSAAHHERPWKIAVSRDGTRTIYERANP